MNSDELTPEQRATLMMVRLDLALSEFKSGKPVDRETLKNALVEQFAAADRRGQQRGLRGSSTPGVRGSE